MWSDSKKYNNQIETVASYRKLEIPTIGGAGGGTDPMSSSETFSSLHIGTRDERSEALLTDSLRVNQETEDIGGATLAQLQRQREQLEGAQEQAQDTHQVTRQARQTLKAISWKILREKLTLVLVILCLLTIDVALAYRLATHKGKL